MSDIFDNSCLGACAPVQILNIEMAVNDASDVVIKDNCGNAYGTEQLKYSYSVDGLCWSCYMTYEEIVENTINDISDFFIRIKVPGEVTEVEVNGETTDDYSVSLDSEFQLSSYCGNSNYNPYANIEGAIQLQQGLSDAVACTIGIPIYYFKASGKAGSADMTFKEYALKQIDSVKQIKLIIGDGQMPSSKPEFSELGLDWQTDWQTEISKSMFATAFGIEAQPMEGDLIYIPMMKRMWMVNEAYDERNGSLMWQSTTWQVYLTKYQADGSMDLNVHEDFVGELVKNKYEDIFGNDEHLNSGLESVDLTRSRPANLYSVFEQDSTRKEMTCDTIDFQQTGLYHKNTLVMDNCYVFQLLAAPQSFASQSDAFQPIQITYQRPYCGDDLSISFIIRCIAGNMYEDDIIEIGHYKIHLKQEEKTSTLSCNLVDGKSVTIDNNSWWFVTIRHSKSLHTFDMTASLYTYPEGIPLYKLTNHNYYFDVDNARQIVGRWNSEMSVKEKTEVKVNGFYGNMSNFKVWDAYNQSMSELMMQYPTSVHLLINDTARPLYGLLGVTQS